MFYILNSSNIASFFNYVIISKVNQIWNIVILFSLESTKCTVLHELDVFITSKNPPTGAKIKWY